ncbi:hypothetical protein Ciccas_009082 [Cichlidogyrus casuarinus]|uniref:Nucleoporin Nup133/Nup155-like C-terminal domain-containing protein n=1 Tax=Cichlidogyrus casuarinus TaxID=1844966 RepID=A0ABD2PZR3_9PLAT
MDAPVTQTDRVYNHLISRSLFLLTGTCLYLSRCIRIVWRTPLVLAQSSKQQFTNAYRGAALLKIPSLVYDLVAYAVGAHDHSTSDHKTLASQYYMSQLSHEDLEWLAAQLDYLCDFIGRNMDISVGMEALLKPEFAFQQQQQDRAVGQQAITETVFNRLANDAKLIGCLSTEMHQLSKATLEIVSFWSILAHSYFNDILHTLSVDQQKSLLTTPVESYVQSILPVSPMQQQPQQATGSGAALASDLIEALVHCYLDHLLAMSVQTTSSLDASLKVNVDQYMQELNQRCPSLFSNHAAQIAKACECLQQAMHLCDCLQAQSPVLLEHLCLRSLATENDTASLMHDRISQAISLCEPQLLKIHAQILESLHDAVSLLQSTASSATVPINLSDLCERLVKVRIPEAWICATRLCLFFAQVFDPKNLALQCFKESRRPSTLNSQKSDRSEASIVESRYEAYRVLLNLLDQLLDMARLPQSATDWDVDQPTLQTSLQAADNCSHYLHSETKSGQNLLGYLWKTREPFSLTFMLVNNQSKPNLAPSFLIRN